MIIAQIIFADEGLKNIDLTKREPPTFKANKE
jgi:hypothetical protein